jgi:hypothetical protein
MEQLAHGVSSAVFSLIETLVVQWHLRILKFRTRTVADFFTSRRGITADYVRAEERGASFASSRLSGRPWANLGLVSHPQKNVRHPPGRSTYVPHPLPRRQCGHHVPRGLSI